MEVEDDRIVIERRNLFVRLTTRILPTLTRIDRSVTNFVSPVGITTLGILTLYYTALSYGLVVVALMGGRHGLTRVVGTSNTHPILIIVAIPMIPVALVCLEGIELEERTLSLWRQSVSPVLTKIPILGRMVSYFWPPMTREPFGAYRNSSGSMLTTLDYLARSLTGGLLLPFLGFVIGKSLFRNKGNTLQRTIVGSLIFYVLKFSIKTILKHHQYRRQGFRRVLNYNPSLEPLEQINSRIEEPTS